MRTNIPGESPYESVIGFSRAVRVGERVLVSGTGPVGADEAGVEEQAHCVLGIIGQALEKAGASLAQVVRTRIYLTNREDWEPVGRVHGEAFGAVRPAATMVVVSALLHPAWRVEMEAEAVLDE